MTATEIEPAPPTTGDDDLPLAHIPDEQSTVDEMFGGRATRALCGADLLGIPVIDLPGLEFRRCPECTRIADEQGLSVRGGPNVR